MGLFEDFGNPEDSPQHEEGFCEVHLGSAKPNNLEGLQIQTLLQDSTHSYKM